MDRSNRIVIVGGGVAGLSIAARVAQAGFPVTVLEASQLGAGASTRNQGWLHSGGWFAPTDAGLAQLCYESLQQTLAFCPDSISANSTEMLYLVSRADTDVGRWTNAWDAAAIPYEEISSEALASRFPGLAIARSQHAFELPDRSLRVDRLLRRLAECAEAAGVEIRGRARVARLIDRDGHVQSVELDSGERVSARLVILAGNTKTGSLFPGFGAAAVGGQQKVALRVLKTHLLAVRPQLSRSPLCVVDAEGFNHLPHQPMSVLGTSRWITARHGEDEQIDPDETARLWHHATRLFPDLEPAVHRVAEWAGVAVHPLPLSTMNASLLPMPIVIDHEQEDPRVGNLMSVFPGRATLWPHLAETARDVVLTKLQRDVPTVAQPPWGTPSGGGIGAPGLYSSADHGNH